MRKIILDLNGLTPEQQLMDDYERTYSCTLYEHLQSPWGRDYDPRTGQWVPYKYRKPDFVDPLPREIIDSITASIFGYDKFPATQARSYDMAYSEEAIREMEGLEGNDLENIKLAETPNQKRHQWLQLSNEHLRKFVNALLPQKTMAPAMMEAARLSLIMGQVMIFFRFCEGKLFLEVINRKWLRNIVKDPKNPERILSFREQYMFEEADPDNPNDVKKYWFRRDFNENEEIVYFPVEIKNKEVPHFIKDKKNSCTHNFGFCPAVMMEAPNGRSIFFGLMDNLRAFTYLTNGIMHGVRSTMNPQWVATYANTPTVQDLAPKKHGGIWTMPGATSVTAMAPDTKGYENARSFRKEIRDEIIRACRVENDSSNLNYQSGAAIQLRLSPIHDAIGEYRIWFGDRSMIQLVELIINAARILFHRDESSLDIGGNVMVPDMESKIEISLSWGQIKPVTEDDILKAVTVAITAYKGGILTKERAVRKIARYFDIDDIEDMVKILDRLEEEQKQDLMEQEMMKFAAKTQARRDQDKTKETKPAVSNTAKAGAKDE